MAFSYKTPGVYLEEIVKLPPSVASVETAIPCFFGVTQKAIESLDNDLIGVSKKIHSLADYEFFFGHADTAKAEVLVKLNVPSEAKLSTPYVNNMYYAVKHYFDNGGGPCYIHSVGDFNRTNVDATTYKDEINKLDLVDEVTIVVLPDLFGLIDKDRYYDVYNNALQKASALQDKFVVIDVNQEKTNNKVDILKSKTEFRSTISNNIDSIKYGAAYFPFVQTTYQYDYNTANIQMNFSNEVQKIEIEVTINNVKTKVKPYSILNSLDFKVINSMNSLNTIYNDFVKNIFIDTISKSKIDTTISVINNKTANLVTYFNKQQDKIENLLIAKDALLKPFASNVFSNEINKNFVVVEAANDIAKDANSSDQDAIAASVNAAKTTLELANNAIEAAARVDDDEQKNLAEVAKGEAETALAKATDATNNTDKAKAKAISANALAAAKKAKKVSDDLIASVKFVSLKDEFLLLITNQIIDTYKTLPTKPLNVTDTNYNELNNTFLLKITPFFNSAFEAKLKEGFLNIPLFLPPSPAIAGVYASVDRVRGVWKAPANVSLNSVIKPEVLLSDLDQEDFNVDAENGKSINCIRHFVGRGNLVWGARTLAGNNNEWKYVNVRRFFNMVEESCQNATRQFVFEPNDANTWVRVKGMIDNYLTNLWRVGALQGSKPEHAFYVAVGLNQTMTQDDILNGLLIVEIGLAVVRPAEFIVLRFSHKLAVS